MVQSPLEPVTTVGKLPKRAPDAHKGDFGRVLIVAGSRGMSGAAVLCASACLRSGAGLVRVAVPGEILPTVAGANPCYMTVPCAQDMRGRFAASALDDIMEAASAWADVLAIGPGLGQSDAMPGLIAALMERLTIPMVIDADGLNALARLPADSWAGRPTPVILTPHPGEFSRLTQYAMDEVMARRMSLAPAYAGRQGVILVLKSHATIVTNGRLVYRNTTGNPGLATGGTGDVLTGMIAGFLAQKVPPFDSAVMAVWAHGRAGDLAAQKYTQTAMIASDLLLELPLAIRELDG